ncbi:MAG: hypothetical protein M1524_01590 [Patescibacteria group bacterium]|nr:hypothetical protein [Patescibacteria group bacterium]
MRALSETARHIGQSVLQKVDRFVSPPPTEQAIRDARRIIFTQTVLPEDIVQRRIQLIDQVSRTTSLSGSSLFDLSSTIERVNRMPDQELIPGIYQESARILKAATKRTPLP